MLHTNLRELFVPTQLGPGPVQEKPLEPGTVQLIQDGTATFERAPSAPAALIIGEEGENILAIQKPKNVIVPLVTYDSEEAIQERIAAMLECAVLHLFQEPKILSTCALEEIMGKLRTAFAMAPTAILANTETAEAIDKDLGFYCLPGEDPKVYKSPLKIRDGLVIGLRESKYVGHVIDGQARGLGLLVHGAGAGLWGLQITSSV